MCVWCIGIYKWESIQSLLRVDLKGFPSVKPVKRQLHRLEGSVNLADNVSKKKKTAASMWSLDSTEKAELLWTIYKAHDNAGSNNNVPAM